ncbi:MAG: pyridoxal phosphate-dependent aminotransferase [Acidobacteria bacterium]|nr:MAG: pyridoxal phosphate-dependent aminotransferase [Acidobacteriota bacterium]
MFCMNFPVSESVARMQGSPTIRAMKEASKLREKGVEVIDLTVGEPDFPTPDFIKEYAIEGLQKGFTKYTPSEGLKIFTESVAEFFQSQFKAKVSPNQVAATCGGKQAIFNAICSLVNPGDEVLIPKPYWVTFPEIVNFCGAKNVFIETEATEFVITLDQIKAAVTDKTKLLILNSPNNPTGRVIPENEIIKIIEFCADRNIYVIADECYLFFVYPPSKVFTCAVLPEELRKFVCIAGSFSKTFSMTGWRIGFVIADESWIKAMTKLQSHSATHPTSFVQYACAKAMQASEIAMKEVEKMLAEYNRRRNFFIPKLQTIEQIKCNLPEGAFYALVDVREMLGKNGFRASEDVASFLLNEVHVAVTDGAGFGADGFLRLSYATSMENLQKAYEKIKEAFSKF